MWMGVRYAEAVTGPLNMPAGIILEIAFLFAMTTYVRALRTSADAPVVPGLDGVALHHERQ